MERPVLLWDEHNVAHVARHTVTVAEVEQLLNDVATRWARSDTHQAGRLHAWGVTEAGRYLIVVLDTPTPQGVAYVVTARPMTRREKTSYEGGPR